MNISPVGQMNCTPDQYWSAREYWKELYDSELEGYWQQDMAEGRYPSDTSFEDFVVMSAAADAFAKANDI